MIIRVRIKGGRFRDSRPSDLPNGNHDKNALKSDGVYHTFTPYAHDIIELLFTNGVIIS